MFTQDGQMLDSYDTTQHALESAYRYLDRRDRTVSEVRRHLEVKATDAAAIDDALRTLSDQGYLDDARFASVFAQDKRELEQWGADRIRRTLLARGVPRELVDATLDSQPPASELDRALELLRRRFPSPPVDRRERDRAFGVLLRKGYDVELAVDALTTYARSA
jgi:regulatory protein